MGIHAFPVLYSPNGESATSFCFPFIPANPPLKWADVFTGLVDETKELQRRYKTAEFSSEHTYIHTFYLKLEFSE